MQWITLLCAFLLLMMLAIKWRRPLPVFPINAAFADPLNVHLASAAASAQTKGQCHLRLRRAVVSSLEKKLAYLLSVPKEQRLPAVDLLCRGARFVQQEAAEVRYDQKGIPLLPGMDAKQPRVCLFARELILHTAACLDPDSIRRGVQAWQSAQHMTEEELAALPIALRKVMLELLCDLAHRCIADQRTVSVSQAQERAQQTELNQWISNAIASLHAFALMPWDALLESLSSAHAILEQDTVYLSMTSVSRRLYRRKLSSIAAQAHLNEKAAAEVLISLCQSAKADSLESHIGYYLLDDGYPVLLQRLQALTLPARIRIAVCRRACGMCRLASWLVFLAGFLLAQQARLSVWFWLPFSATLLYALRQIVLAVFQKRSAPPLPRMQMDHSSEDNAVLVICPAVLDSTSHAIAVAKHLSILQKANQDAHLHFLLLGEFPGAHAHAQSSDAEIIAAASAAIDALCEDSGQTFLYVQYERTVAGALSAISSFLRLLGGRQSEVRCAFASRELSWFAGRYRCAVVIDEETLLPPDSALQMVGAMLHPLHQSRLLDHRTHGFSMMQPRITAAPHQLQSRLSTLLSGMLSTHEEQLDQTLFHRAAFRGSGIADTAASLETERCAYLGDVTLYAPPPQTLEAYLRHQHRKICSSWSQFRQLLSFKAHPQWDMTSRFQMWRHLFTSLMPLAQLLLLLYAAASGRFWLWFTVLIIPHGGFQATLCHIGMLPCTAYTSFDAVLRTLWQQFSGRELPHGWSFITRRRASDRPPMLFFTLNMGLAGLLAALVLLPSASLAACWLSAAGWALFAFLLPFLEQDRLLKKQPTSYMREVLLRTAKHTLTFFETAITESGHALPPEQVQIEPNKGISHHTTPQAIGLYLCSLVCAQRLGLLNVQEMAQRMADCVHSLEQLPKWKGLPFDRYDTRTLHPAPALFVSAESCGMLAVCLFTAAQGVRALLGQLPEEWSGLSARMDALAEQMQLEALYDHEAKLFYTGIHTQEERPAESHEVLLASSSRLLSFAAVMQGLVPQEHWYVLSRAANQHGLLSQFGSMSAYAAPLLFEPLTPGTLLFAACQKALAQQRKNKLGGAYGISESAFLSLDENLWYQRRSFGIPSLALEADAECSVLSPYASFLSFPLKRKHAFANVQRLEMLGLQGQLGFFDAADFAKARTEGAAMKIVRSHCSDHQAMILCAICNALCSDYLVSLFSGLPRAQAYRLLLEEPVPSLQRRRGRSFRMPEESAASFPTVTSQPAHPLQFPISAHVLHGENTTWLIDAQGGGYLKHGDAFLTRFHERCHLSSGMRIYLRDSQSGACWMAADPWLTDSVQFETSQAVFCHSHLDIRCEMRLWINPLDGSAIHCLTMENQSDADRLMEICSYLEPAVDTGWTAARMNHHGVSAQSDGLAGRLRQLLVSETEPAMFRIQCDRQFFIGRGRSIHAPRALELPISALADCIGPCADPCLSLRAQWMLRAGKTRTFCFVTQLADNTESDAVFCERYDSVEAVVRSYTTALTSSAAITRFVSIDPDLQALSSRLSGALAYTDQPWQTSTADALCAKSLEACGLDYTLPILLMECGAGTDRTVVSHVLKVHAYLHMLGFSFDLVFVLRVRTRSSAARDIIEEEISLSHHPQRKEQRGGVFVVERADENELTLLQWAARLTLQADEPLEQQLDTLVLDMRVRPAYLPKTAADQHTQLSQGEELTIFNGYGGFTKAEGNYQILLPPGTQTPASWCNPLCSPSFATLAGESGLLPEGPISHLSFNEAFYLRDEDHRLLWSPTRQPLGHGVPVRITHAPGETIYESAAYGISARIHCASDVSEQAGLRQVYLKNEDTVSHTLTLFHACVFASAVRLHQHENDALGWDPTAERYVALFSMDEQPRETAVMSAGVFQGLWSRLPFALAMHEECQSSEGSTAVLRFPLTLGAGESITIACGTASAESAEAIHKRLQVLRQSSIGKRLREVRRFWSDQLAAFHFDLPDPALSLLLSRWMPYQTISNLLWSGFEQPANALVLAFSQPRAAHQALRAAGSGDLFSQLAAAYAAACCAAISGDTAFLTQRTQDRPTLLERCTETIEHVELGAHHLPVCGVETAWLGMFLCETIRRLAPFCTQDKEQALMEKRAAMLESLEQYAWEGGRYLYGWDEDGKPIMQLDLNTQSWAVLCGASRDRCVIAMENLWRSLHERTGAVRRDSTLSLFWAISALHQLGETERSWQLLNATLPMVHSSTRQLAARYRAEPYFLPETTSPRERAWCWDGVGWCWMLAAEQLLGFRKAGNTLRFVPIVPPQWEHVRLSYRFGSATYHLHATRDCAAPIADGKVLKNGMLTLEDDGRIHEAFFPLR